MIAKDSSGLGAKDCQLGIEQGGGNNAAPGFGSTVTSIDGALGDSLGLASPQLPGEPLLPSEPQLPSEPLLPSESLPIPSAASLPVPLADIRARLTVALLSDALDGLGRTIQCPRLPIGPLTGCGGLLFGRAKTTLWSDMAHRDPEPYKLELEALDSCQPDDVILCAAAGSMRSGIWGELLSNVAVARGCVGVIVDGAVRDLAKMTDMQFPVFARGPNPYDSRNRQRVTDYDVPIELDGIAIEPGDWVGADRDGLVIVPAAVANQVVQAAWDKSLEENEVRRAVRGGMSATEAFDTYGVL